MSTPIILHQGIYTCEIPASSIPDGAECVSRQKSQVKRLYLKSEGKEAGHIHLHAFIGFRTEAKNYRFQVTLSKQSTSTTTGVLYQDGHALPGSKSALSFGGYRAVFHPQIDTLDQESIYQLNLTVLL